MTETKLIDGFADSLWFKTATAAPVSEPLRKTGTGHGAGSGVDSGSDKCDVVIVGAGFTGLNAALKLASNGVDVRLLEAGQLGIGSSGRSGGQVNLGLNLSPAQLLNKFGKPQGERIIDAVGRAPDYVFNLIKQHHLQCDAVQKGWVQAAVTPALHRQQESLVEDYARFGIELSLLDKAAMQAATGTSAYVGGMVCPIAGCIQPLSYTRELARVVSKRGAMVYTDSPVTQLEKTSEGWRVSTAQAQLTCSTVLLCTNAYTDTLVSGLAKTMVPVRSVLMASEPLPQTLRDEILPGGITFVDKRRLILYCRYDRDGRLCIGDHGPSRDRFKLSDFDNLKKRTHAIFPQLRDVSWDYHWGGRVAMTKDTLPFIHEIAPGLVAGMGYNGRGVAMGSMMGALLADKILSDSNDCAFPVTHPDKFKMHLFRDIGVGVAIKWATLRDYLEGL